MVPEAILTHLLEVLVWEQERALQHEGINQLHLAFLRRANRHHEVTFTEIATYTGADKDSISHAARFLEQSDLAIVEPIADDKRRRKLRLTPLGRKRLKAVEKRIFENVLVAIRIGGTISKRADRFFNLLWKATWLLPAANIASLKTYRPSRIKDRQPKFVEGPEREADPNWSPD